MKAEEAKRRYELTLAREDNYYYYVNVLPRFPEDKADFQRAELVLTKGFLPARLWFEEVNKNTVQWDILRIESNSSQVSRGDFYPPQTPPGWTAEHIRRQNPATGKTDNPPRVIRPNQ
jgi:hypothetical protein